MSEEVLAQVSFEPGYLINAEGVRVECLIENKEWLNNPSKFRYKLSETGDIQTGDIYTINEISIKSELKYIKAKVKIDRSSNNLNSLSKSKDPEFQDEILFLKVLIEGSANLYSYTEKDLRRFFFSANGSEISQLVYKKYATSIYMGENRFYRQQLSSSVNCQAISRAELENLSYSKKELKKYFVKYNACMGQDFTEYKKAKRKRTYFTLKGGLVISEIELTHNSTASKGQVFPTDYGYAVNFEMEHIMSFNKNKWSFILEPGFNSIEIPGEAAADNAGLTYMAISIPIGLRHSIYFNKSTRIMLSLMWNFDIATNSEVYMRNGTPLEVEMNNHLSIGLGFKYKRLVFESSFHPTYDILSNYVVIGVYKSDLRFALGYTLF